MKPSKWCYSDYYTRFDFEAFNCRVQFVGLAQPCEVERSLAGPVDGSYRHASRTSLLELSF